MALDPTLIIQMQRMGDLVLGFPLMAWLLQMEPERPVWVVAEPEFYQALMPFAPDVVFFGMEAAPALRKTAFHRVINLSHREEACTLAAQLSTVLRLGMVNDATGTRIEGAWHVYRSSIVHNNRHNRFHWADLAALDSVPQVFLPHTTWPLPRIPSVNEEGEGRIGLFVGASEADKRPPPQFWGALAMQLVKKGYNPVFLGGKTERPLAGEAARIVGLPGANLAGLFDLENFADLIGRLDLLVTPDTGPMHVGAWMRTPTLNLSIGPVNPWETAPAVPGHLVLRAEPSCAGCWHCTREREAFPPCHAPFAPHRIAAVIHTLMHNQAHRLHVPGLRLMRTSRDARGLFMLDPIDKRPLRTRDLVGNFWREAFLDLLGGPQPHLGIAVEALRNADPKLTALLLRHTKAVVRQLALPKKGNELWLLVPPLFRPFSSYAQMVWDNKDHTKEAREELMAFARRLLEALVA